MRRGGGPSVSNATEQRAALRHPERRRGVIPAVVGLVWALGAVAVALLVPLGKSVSVDASGGSTRSSYTLLESEGSGILVVLAIPVALAAASVLGVLTGRAWLTRAAALLLAIGVLLGAASIGLFFVPSAIAVAIAASRQL